MHLPLAFESVERGEACVLSSRSPVAGCNPENGMAHTSRLLVGLLLGVACSDGSKDEGAGDASTGADDARPADGTTDGAADSEDTAEPPTDADGDGYVSEADGGDDCNDTDPSVHPGATEAWYDGVDSDCDGHSDNDADFDGYDAADQGGDDCDDTDPATHPDAEEVWDDGIDQDCDGTVDRADSSCSAEFVFRTPNGDAEIDGCEEWSMVAAFEFDPDDVPEVRSFALSFDGSAEAEFECRIALTQDHVCGTGYYRQGNDESGQVEVVTLDCSGVVDEDETTFSGIGYLHLTRINTGSATGSFADQPLYTGLEGSLVVGTGDYTLSGTFSVGATQLAGDREEQLECASSDGDLDDDGSLDVFYDGEDCDDTDPFVGPGFAANDSAVDCMRDADDDDWGDAGAIGAGLVAGTDCADSDATVHPTAASAEPSLCTVDADGDGYGDLTAEAPAEAGTDCNDDDSAEYPGAVTEAVSGECMTDQDGDGYGDVVATGLYDPGTDCNDDDSAEYPGAVTEAVSGECMTDQDGDGYGDAGASGLYDAGTDCNDGDGAEYPGAVTEATSGACMTDQDGDGYGDAGASGLYDAGTDCNDDDSAEYPGAVTEASATECMRDADSDGYGDLTAGGLYDNGTDCDDASAATYPGAASLDSSYCMRDVDGDGYGSSDVGWPVQRGTDCDDSSADIYLGAASLEPALCTRDADTDGYGDDSLVSPVDAGLDCDDGDAGVHPDVPGIDLLDGVDINCDGQENYNDLSSGSIAHTVVRATGAWEEAGSYLSFGDVNADGHIDVHIGSGVCSDGGWVLNGPLSAWPADFDSADASYESASLWYGCRGNASGALGDVDNDGFDDLLAVDFGDSIEVTAGHVFAGPLSGTLDATIADFSITKGDPDTCMPNGYSFGADDDDDSILIDDLDGDGDDDVVFGSPLWWTPCTAGNYYKGAVFLFEGPLSAGIDAEDASVTWIGDSADSYLGQNFDILTDVDGDGTNDLAVTQVLFPTALFVFYDPLSHLGGTASTDADFSPADFSGMSARLGDHNADGYGDLAVLDGSYTAYEIDIYNGSASGLGASPVATVGMGWLQAEAFRGDGDFNADGYDDLALGRFLLTGPMSGALDAQDDALGEFDADDFQAAERSVALQDLDADGYAELLLGSRGDSMIETWSGALFVVPGQ